MEQYWMPKELDFENLRLCLDNHHAERLFIRDCGGVREDGKYSAQGMAKVSENLEGRTLNFRKDDSGLYMLIDSNEVFHFPLLHHGTRERKGFSMAYERIIENGDDAGRQVMLQTGVDPYDPILPEPRMSTLRQVIDDHLIEIDFEGRVHLKFHSWWQKPNWKLWQVGLEKQEPDWDFIRHWMFLGYKDYR